MSGFLAGWPVAWERARERPTHAAGLRQRLLVEFLCPNENENLMREDQQQFLRLLGQLPSRLTAEQAGWVLNCQPHDVPALLAAKLLKPLGNPSPNTIKFFATADLLELMQDRNWLVRVTSTINQHWHNKNARQKNRQPDSVPASQI